MIPHAVQNGDLKEYHYSAYRAVVNVLTGLPDHSTCHDVVKNCVGPLQTLFRNMDQFHKHPMPGKAPVPYHGTFNGLDHSWFVFEDDKVILDPYPWAAGSGPLLVSTAGCSPWTRLYKGTPSW